MKLSLTARNTTTIALPWLGLALLIILSIGLLLPIQPNDYWWYVRVGQDIVRDGAIPSVDTLSYTQAGQPMVYHAWLASVIFWVLDVSGGATLTVLARGILLGSFYFFAWRTCRLAGAGPKLAAMLVLLAALAGSNNWATRPQLFSFPCFSAMLYILWRWHDGENRHLWLLPVLVAAWVNLHGAFVLSFLLVGAALVGGGGDRRALFLALLGMALASTLNPRFLGSWGYVFSLLTDPPSQTLGAEWSPPRVGVWQQTLFFAWLLLMIPLAAFSSKRFSPVQWLWFLGFGWMSLDLQQ